MFEEPYILTTNEDLRKAKAHDIFNLEARSYEQAIQAASSIKIKRPNLLSKIRTSIALPLYCYKKDILKSSSIQYRDVANLDALYSPELIQQHLPDIQKIISYKELSSYTRAEGLNEDINSANPTALYNFLLQLRAFLKRELLAYISSKKTAKISDEKLKGLICAYAIFDYKNEDIQMIIKKMKPNSTAYQRACEELLFNRIRLLIEELVPVDYKIIFHRFSQKVFSIKTSNNNKSYLSSYLCHQYEETRDINKAIIKTKKVIPKVLSNMNEITRLTGYLTSLLSIAEEAKQVYYDLFLDDPMLKKMQDIYLPARLAKEVISTKTEIVRRLYLKDNLILYPTKDYGDLFKSFFSEDCSLKIAQAHLVCPNFFNLRIFSDITHRWIGNIYMLDLISETGVLIVDRIQIPRNEPAEYVDLFKNLAETLKELFSPIGYKMILLPQRVSNHSSVQKAFNGYKKHLPKERLKTEIPFGEYIESLKKDIFYVLVDKGD